jgi:hypothetical protein
MIFIGVLITFLGFLLSVASLAISSSVGVRMVVVLIGIGVSLFGIMGIINRACLKDAIWRKP